jgi:hypothetical protein
MGIGLGLIRGWVIFMLGVGFEIIDAVVVFASDEDFVKVFDLSDVEEGLAQVGVGSILQVLNHLGRAFLVLVGLVEHWFGFAMNQACLKVFSF